MDVVYISQKIEQKIKLLERGRTELNDLMRTLAQTRAEYDKAVAVAIVMLRNGHEYKVGDESIKDPPVSIIDKLTRGICHEEKLAVELAEGMSKACIEKLKAVQAELNGYQSINRHLSAT